MRIGRKIWFYLAIPTALACGVAHFAFNGTLLSKHHGQVSQDLAAQMRTEQLEDSRTHETRLLPDPRPYSHRGDAFGVLSKLKPLSELNADGLRFVAIPSATMSYYGVVLTLESTQATEAVGVISIFATGGSETLDVEEREFSMPANEYRTLTSTIDKLTDGWPGESGFVCLDGTTTAFERVRNERITSGAGDCGTHYEALRAIILAKLRKFVPEVKLPHNDDWRMPPP
ncbi:hypothetical protein [Sphingomonas sp. IC081]|uniref:hypothetical protein n=1 Tax=Sphingomonas sp. IC081 TaxID=304378 RepID=UPI00115BDE8D|nr:hypothetical protein [Sphingomonas sp. IC081]